jgi:hypothetical protein
MTHRIGLVTYDSYLHAWVLDLPGCVVGGRSMAEIQALLPLVIAEHVAWLNGHGEKVGEPGQWGVVETADARALAATGGEFCFGDERQPLTRDELERGIARMDYARVDLLAAVDSLPDVILDWEPPRSTVSTFDPWAPETRSMRGIMKHVLQLEAYYRDGLRDGEAAGIFGSVDSPSSERARTAELLWSLTDDERGRVFRPQRPSRGVSEEWTVRKVLRRIISHERAHAAEILQRRTWLLLGLPRVSGG